MAGMKNSRVMKSWQQLCGRLLAVLLLTGAAVLFGAEATVRSDSPTRYTVVEGDTLWDIAGRFLEEPWLWPEVWQVNPQIANPDLIFPGDVIELGYENGSPVLRLSRSDAPAGIPTIRLSPQVRREPMLSPIPAIPLDQISAHLSGNAVVGASDYDAAPYLLGESEGHSLAAAGDEIYARGSWTEGLLSYDIVRRGRSFEDPDTGQALGVEGILVGTATLSRTNGSEAILRVDQIKQEIRVGDRLIPREANELDSSYLPAPPPFAVDAAIVSIGSGRVVGGRLDSLLLNAGRDDGLQPGHLLTVREPEVVLADEQGDFGTWRRFKQVLGFDDGDQARFPGDIVATVLIYRVFDQASLGFVLDSDKPIRLNDRATTP